MTLLITREIDYALRILRTLSRGDKIPSIEICRAESMPQQFTYKILSKLARAGFVENTRGPEGGCLLTMDLREKTLYDLMKILGANEYITSCMEPGYECSWRNQHQLNCSIHRQMGRIQQKINEELQSRSLHDILFGDVTD